MSKPIELQKGDIVRRKRDGELYTVVDADNARELYSIKNCETGRILVALFGRCYLRFISRPTKIKVGDRINVIGSEVELAPKTAEVVIDINTNSIESMEKALKEIDTQRDILADKLLAKKKEERAKANELIRLANEKEISDMLNSIKSQSGSIQIRTSGIFKGKGVYLSSHYNWEIKVDEYGIKVLVPTMVAIVPTKP